MCCHLNLWIFWVLCGATLSLGLGRVSLHIRGWLSNSCCLSFPSTGIIGVSQHMRSKRNAVTIILENCVSKHCLGCSWPLFVFWKLALQSYRPFSCHLCNWCPQEIFFLMGYRLILPLTAYRCSEMSSCLDCQGVCVLSTRGPQKISSYVAGIFILNTKIRSRQS